LVQVQGKTMTNAGATTCGTSIAKKI